nr:ABC transporter substrate-binding protein [Bacillus sp. B15-48]
MFLAQQKGLGDANVIEVKDYLNVPSDVFVVTEKTYEEKKDELEKLINAYRNSAQWMVDNPEEAASLAKKYAIDGKDEEVNLEIIKLRNASTLSDDTKNRGLGAIDVNLLQAGADTYRQLGLVKNKLDLSQVVTEEFLEENNR